MGTITTAPLNRYSFLRFSTASGFTVVGNNVTSAITVNDNDPNFKNGYRERGYRSVYFSPTLILHGDDSTYLTATLETGTFDSNTVTIFAESTGNSITGATATAVRFNSNKSIFIKIDYSGTASSLDIIGRLLIGTNKVSNRFLFARYGNYSELYNNAQLIEYSGLTDWYDFSYNFEVTLGAYTGRPFNRLKIPASFIEQTYPNNGTQYRNVTDGQIRILRQLIDNVSVLETYKFDNYAHEAMAIATNHSTFKVNNIDYILADGEQYNPNELVDMPVSNGTVSLTNQTFTRKNKPCLTASS